MSKFVKFSLVVLLISFIGSILWQPGSASALSGSDFNAGRIADDVIFFTPNTITTNDIQSFLNAKLPVCDTNGSQSYAGTNRAGYGTSRGYPPPYICLKDYRQNTPQRSAESGLCNGYNAASNQTAAQIIYNVANSCGVNAKVLIVLLQKEQSLVTDDWPWSIQYRSATGYGCPDTAACDSEYYGFFNQVYAAARQFKRYARDSNLYNYKAGLNNFIQYNPNTGCSGTNVVLQNQATAGLYNYTPYQPNAAALNNLYGIGDGCSAYGNRNFWRMFHDWFGSPTNDAYLWEVIHETATGKLYLVVGNKRHHIPNPTILAAWGLDDDSYRDVTTNYVNQLAGGPALQSVALDINGTRYLMSQGKRYKLKSDGYVLIWGVAGMDHISAPGLLSQTPSGGDAGRFAKVGSTTYLLNNYQKHLPLEADSFGHWGVSVPDTTTVLASDIAHLEVGANVGQFISFGTSKKIIDQGKLLVPKNSNIAEGWEDQAYVSVLPFASNILSTKTLGSFVSKSSDNRIYFVENGNRHYVPSPDMTVLWNMGPSNPLTGISDKLFENLLPKENLSYIVKTSAAETAYIITENSRQLTSKNLESLYSDNPELIPIFSRQSLSTLSNGSVINSPLVKFPKDSKVYALDNGNLRHVSSPSALKGLGSQRNNPVVSLPKELKSSFSASSSIGDKVTNGSSTHYLENGYRYRLDVDYVSTWKATNPSLISTELLNETTNSGQTLGAAVRIGNNRYLVNNGVLIDVSSNYPTFGLSSSDFGRIFEKNMPSTGVDGYFVQSMTGSKVYVLSYGKIYHISNPQTLSDLGFGVYSGVIKLHPNIMNGLLSEQSTKASRLIKSPTSGVLFASLRKGFIMPNLSTLTEYRGDKSYMVLDAKFFNKFKIVGTARKLISGTSGKVYAVDDNEKRWLTSPSALSSFYPGEPILNLPQLTIDGFATGPNIN